MVLDYLTAFWTFIVNQDNHWWQILIAALIIIFTFFVRGILTRIVLNIIIRLTKKTRTELDRVIMLAFEGQLKVLIFIIGLFLAFNYLPLSPGVMIVLTSLFRSAIIVLIAWGLFNLAGNEAYNRVSYLMKLEQGLAIFVSKGLRAIIIALAFVIVIQEWGYDVSGLIAGLGIGGLALSLAAKDALANIFGGVMIILDKPFAVGDWILTPSVEGTVEEMSLRSTRVRTFANSLVTVPNAVLANEAITNWTRMQKRRITFHLGVTYTTPRHKLQNCVNKIKDLLKNHPDVHPDLIMVHFDQFAGSSLDIFIYFFTRTKVWTEFLAVKEDINFKIMEILEKEGVSVAFPSRSIYFENKLQSESSLKDPKV